MGLDYCRVRRGVLAARRLVIRGTTAAGSGHPGGSFSMAEIAGVLLFGGHLRHDPSNPLWEGRDRLVLSKGHAAPGLFSSLAVAGYFDESEIETLRSLGSRLQGHPDLKCPGVEFCGGSLGIGLSYSLGVALAVRMGGGGQRVYAILGDGETDEGQVWEAAMAASKYGVDNLTAILDRNFIQQDSYTEAVMPLDRRLGHGEDPSAMWRDPSRWRTADKWRAFGWNVIEVDGHRIEQLGSAVRAAAAHRGSPTMIIARTIKGKGVEHMEDNPQWHGRAADPDVAPVIDAELGCQFAVAPSITAGDMGDLPGEVRRCEEGRADMIHIDVMDGRFVPAVTFGAEKVAELRALTDLPLDTHLMVADPVREAARHAEAGSDIVTVHAEACDESLFGEVHDLLRAARVGVGLAVNPGTELPGWAAGFAPTLDQVIVMSVEPGRSGQRYIEAVHAKTARLCAALDAAGFAGTVEADGGVTAANAGACLADGCRSFVGGSAIVGQADVRAAVRAFRESLADARRRLLLRRAHDLGGPELAQKWIGLHNVGSKAARLGRLAGEEGAGVAAS